MFPPLVRERSALAAAAPWTGWFDQSKKKRPPTAKDGCAFERRMRQRCIPDRRLLGSAVRGQLLRPEKGAAAIIIATGKADDYLQEDFYLFVYTTRQRLFLNAPPSE
jgi:hypothetical protein